MTEPDTKNQPAHPLQFGAKLEHSLSLKEVAALMVQKLDIHEGLWDLGFEVQVALGSMGLPPDVLPGAAFRFARLGLTRVTVEGPNTVNAAEAKPT